jgi:hypothetical protein
LASDRPLRFLLALGVASMSAACALDWAGLRSDGGTTPGEDAADAGEENSEAGDTDANGNESGGACNESALIINEVQVAGAAGAADEFVEIHNPTSCDLRLEGFTLRYSSSTGNTPLALWTGTANDAIAPGAYVVVGGTGYAGELIGRFDGGGLAALGGGIGLFNSGGKVLDSVAYGAINAGHPLVRPAGGKAAPAPPTGQSIARTPDAKDTETNETDFVIATTPTPGAKN